MYTCIFLFCNLNVCNCYHVNSKLWQHKFILFRRLFLQCYKQVYYICSQVLVHLVLDMGFGSDLQEWIWIFVLVLGIAALYCDVRFNRVYLFYVNKGNQVKETNVSFWSFLLRKPMVFSYAYALYSLRLRLPFKRSIKEVPFIKHTMTSS